MPTYPIETNTPALKTGYSVVDDGCVYDYAIFTEDAALNAVEKGCDDVAEALTGWTRSYRGPGRAFSDDPIAKLFGKKVLVTQRRGIDI